MPGNSGRAGGADPQARLDEAKGLALAIGLVVADAIVLPLRQVRPATLFGEGQIQRIAAECEMENVELVIVDGALSGIQQRNLEEKLKRKVIDRTGLILDIFGERAATPEGRLQVELAHLDYQQSRLVRSWTHLERQRGGFGFLGGPGETQIEADRRMIRERMGRCGASSSKSAAPARSIASGGARAVAGDRAGRLHQCRQVDAVQPPDRRRRNGRGLAVRHADPR